MPESNGDCQLAIEPMAQSGHSIGDVLEFMLSIDDDLDPPLRTRVDMPSYVQKVVQNACVLIAHERGTISGLAAVYMNDHQAQVAYVTYIGLAREARGHGLAKRLMQMCLRLAFEAGMRTMRLETSESNVVAQRLYLSMGFRPEEADDNCERGMRRVWMAKRLCDDESPAGIASRAPSAGPGMQELI